MAGSDSLGAPVFNEQGTLTGIVTRYVSPEKEAGEGVSSTMRMAQNSRAMTRVILPTAEVVKLVGQAKDMAQVPSTHDFKLRV